MSEEARNSLLGRLFDCICIAAVPYAHWKSGGRPVDIGSTFTVTRGHNELFLYTEDKKRKFKVLLEEENLTDGAEDKGGVYNEGVRAGKESMKKQVLDHLEKHYFVRRGLIDWIRSL